MAAIEAGNALLAIASDPSRLLVTFTDNRRDPERLAALSALARPPEQLQTGNHAMYLWCPNGILESKAAEALLGKAGRGVTTRNWATVLKIMAVLKGNAT